MQTSCTSRTSPIFTSTRRMAAPNVISRTACLCQRLHRIPVKLSSRSQVRPEDGSPYLTLVSIDLVFACNTTDQASSQCVLHAMPSGRVFTRIYSGSVRHRPVRNSGVSALCLFAAKSHAAVHHLPFPRVSAQISYWATSC